MSAEELSCLEGVYTVRRSEKQAGDESDSEKKLRQLTVCSVFWLGPVTNEELAENQFRCRVLNLL